MSEILCLRIGVMTGIYNKEHVYIFYASIIELTDLCFLILSFCCDYMKVHGLQAH